MVTAVQVSSSLKLHNILILIYCFLASVPAACIASDYLWQRCTHQRWRAKGRDWIKCRPRIISAHGVLRPTSQRATDPERERRLDDVQLQENTMSKTQGATRNQRVLWQHLCRDLTPSWQLGSSCWTRWQSSGLCGGMRRGVYINDVWCSDTVSVGCRPCFRPTVFVAVYTPLHANSEKRVQRLHLSFLWHWQSTDITSNIQPLPSRQRGCSFSFYN